MSCGCLHTLLDTAPLSLHHPLQPLASSCGSALRFPWRINQPSSFCPVLSCLVLSCAVLCCVVVRDRHELVRRQALALLANLLMKDYVKWRGPLFHR